MESHVFRRQLIHFRREPFVCLCQCFDLCQFVLLERRRNPDKHSQETGNPQKGMQRGLEHEIQEGHDDWGRPKKGNSSG